MSYIGYVACSGTGGQEMEGHHPVCGTKRPDFHFHGNLPWIGDSLCEYRCCQTIPAHLERQIEIKHIKHKQFVSSGLAA